MLGGVERVTLDVRAGTRLPWYLRPGQLVLVEVVERLAHGGIVNLGGQLFPARGRLPAEGGTRFWCMVEGAAPEVINLRRLEPAVPGLQTTPLRNILVALGLPPEEELEKVVQEFMRWRLPLDRNEILETAVAVRRFPVPERRAFLQVHVWLRTLNLPEAAARAVETYLLGRVAVEEDEGSEGTLADRAAQGQFQLNRAQPSPPGIVIDAFALIARQAAGDIYIVRREGAAGEHDGVVQFVIHLVTASFGSIWVVLKLQGAELGVQIFCDPERADAIRQAVPALREQLAAGGYRVRACEVTARSVTSVVELLGEVPPAEYVGLDITV